MSKEKNKIEMQPDTGEPDQGVCSMPIDGKAGKEPVFFLNKILPYIKEDEALDGAHGLGGFIDVETTGLDACRDEIIELSIVLFAYNRKTGQITGIVDEYTGLREPSVPISKAASRVNGLTLRKVRGRRLDMEKIQSILARAEFLVAHNAAFDKGFVCQLFAEAAQKPWLCSMRGVNWRQKGYASRSLQNLLQAHAIQVERAHRAENDVKAALVLLSCSGPDGRSYFSELLGKLA